MSEAFVVGGVRTPFGRYGGALATVRPDDLLAAVVAEAITRSGVEPDAVDEVVIGAANQAGEDNRNVARMAALLAGLPDSVPGLTVNRLCASSLSAVALAAQAIRAGDADIVVAGGVESMTRAPWVLAKPGRPWSKPGEVADSSLGWRFVNPRFADIDHGLATLALGETAEEVASLDQISRAASDAYGLESQERTARAAAAGWLAAEILPITTDAGTVGTDECPRQTSLGRLAALAPAFRPEGVVTAGTASPLADGAVAMVLASEPAAARLSAPPRARVVATTSAGVPPHLMGLGPVPATERLLARVGLDIDDIDVIEINEAFAPQVLACCRRLGVDPAAVNVAGGAIALGHPLGASGGRLVLSALGTMERTPGRYGLVTMCVGVGQGVALLLERP